MPRTDLVASPTTQSNGHAPFSLKRVDLSYNAVPAAGAMVIAHALRAAAGASHHHHHHHHHHHPHHRHGGGAANGGGDGGDGDRYPPCIELERPRRAAFSS